MKKAFLSVVLTIALIACSFGTVFAADKTFAEVLDSCGVLDGLSVTIDAPANIMARNSNTSIWSDGPIVVKKASNEDYPTFDFTSTLYMQNVRDEFNQYISTARSFVSTYRGLEQTDVDNVKVSGQFTITVTIPADLELPDDIVNGTDMYGFNSEAKTIFSEVSRNFVKDGNWNIGTIIIKVAKDGNDYVLAKDLETNLNSYLADITFECDRVKTSKKSTYRLHTDVTGYTDLKDNSDNDITRITYNIGQLENHNPSGALNVVVSVTSTSSSSGGSSINLGGGSSSSDTDDKKPDDGEGTGTTPKPGNISLSFDLGDGSSTIDSISDPESVSVNLGTIETPTKENAAFDGWYMDKECTEEAPEELTINKDTVIYAKWKNTNAPKSLISDPHPAYVIGYPDGLVHPNGNITRAELATIFYRLLKDDVRNEYQSSTNNFTDVPADLWSNEAISTMAKGGYVSGYEDGSFKPDNYITRAEFVTIASRFAETLEDTDSTFYDIAGHWAEKYIITATKNYWINGYEDGTFRPNNYITRAEAMTVVNNMLVRYIDKDSNLTSCKQWDDNNASDWYYYQVLEATNSHSFARRDNGIYENWEEE